MSAAIVFLVIFIFILLALAVVFLILWLKDKNKKNDTKELQITGTKFSVKDQNTAVATWDSVASTNDQVILYADTVQIDLDQNGVPETDKNPDVLKSSVVPGSAKEVSVTGLKEDNTKYFVKLVVTNTTFSGYNSESGQVVTGGIPDSPFVISEINTPGAITLEETNTPNILYVTKVNKSNINDLWTYDKTKFTLTQPGTGTNSGKTWVLFRNNILLEARELTTLKNTESAEWEFNVKGDSKWCLKSNPDICMNLVTTGTNRITLINNSKSQWINTPTTDASS